MAEHKDKKKVDVKKKVGFIQEMKAEIKRIAWPTRQKLIRSTAAVFLISLAFALLIWCVDFLVAGGLNMIGFNDVKAPTQTVAETTVVETQTVEVPTETTGK